MENREKVLNALIENGYKYRCYGLRTDDRELSVGDKVGNSHDLYDNYDPEYDHYGEELDGTSATGFGYLWYDEDDMEEVEKALKIQEHYYRGAHQYLIAGDDDEYGDDEAEIIIRDAVVVAVIR